MPPSSPRRYDNAAPSPHPRQSGLASSVAVIVTGVGLWYLATEKKRRLHRDAQRAEDKVRKSEIILLADIEALRRTGSPLLGRRHRYASEAASRLGYRRKSTLSTISCALVESVFVGRASLPPTPRLRIIDLEIRSPTSTLTTHDPAKPYNAGWDSNGHREDIRELWGSPQIVH